MEKTAAEALSYLGIKYEGAAEEMKKQALELTELLLSNTPPRHIYRIFTIVSSETGFILEGSGIELSGNSAATMLSDCDSAVLMACTLGMRSENLIRSMLSKDMSRAVILDSCASALVEAGCDNAEEEIRSLFPDKYLTDRFSPGYGDLPLDIQPLILQVLDAEKRLGIHLNESLLMNPSKSVTAVIGISDRPQAARIRGCAFCSMQDSCMIRKNGSRCTV